MVRGAAWSTAWVSVIRPNWLDRTFRLGSPRFSTLNRFEIADPSLEAVFIEHVGRPPADEQHLAAPGLRVEGDIGGEVEGATR